MPGTGSYTGPNTNSDYLFEVSVALEKLKDNSSQLIDPKDIRDSVWTLWNRIDDIQTSASQSIVLSGSASFTNPNPTSVTVGGIAAGKTFSAVYSVQQMFDLLLYPYQSPQASLSASGSPRQFGSGLSTTLSWSATKKSNALTSIIVNGNTLPLGPFSGTITTTATHSLSYASTTQQSTSYSMSVSDGTSTVSAGASVVWQHKKYWGSVDLSTVPSYPNPTLEKDGGPFTPAVTAVGTYITSAIIRGLTGAGIGTGNALTTTYAASYDGIDGQGRYLIFAHPTMFGSNPQFTINSLPQTYFQKVWSAVSFTNEFGLTLNYDVWVSNTAQNSPIKTFKID